MKEWQEGVYFRGKERKYRRIDRKKRGRRQRQTMLKVFVFVGEKDSCVH